MNDRVDALILYALLILGAATIGLLADWPDRPPLTLGLAVGLVVYSAQELGYRRGTNR